MSLKHEIFPTPIWGFQWGDASFISRIKQHCLDLQKRLPNRDKSNFLGWQSPDDMHTDSTFSPLIDKILEVMTGAVAAGLSERQTDKDKAAAEKKTAAKTDAEPAKAEATSEEAK